MDTQLLVDRLREIFAATQGTERTVDAFALAPAYGGMVKDAYILGVAAPMLGKSGCHITISTYVYLLHEKLPAELMSAIDRVRVYDSVEKLRYYAKCNFDEESCDVCERPLHQRSEVFELETV